MKSKILSVLMFILGICLTCAFVYGMCWIAKHVSYSLFYEDMVRETVLEMLKGGLLK